MSSPLNPMVRKTGEVDEMNRTQLTSRWTQSFPQTKRPHSLFYDDTRDADWSHNILLSGPRPSVSPTRRVFSPDDDNAPDAPKEPPASSVEQAEFRKERAAASTVSN